jgi:hypothetical protein
VHVLHGRYPPKPLFTCNKDRDEIWMMLLEKAFAKVYGSYAAIESGQVWVSAAYERSNWCSHSPT